MRCRIRDVFIEIYILLFMGPMLKYKQQRMSIYQWRNYTKLSRQTYVSCAPPPDHDIEIFLSVFFSDVS